MINDKLIKIKRFNENNFMEISQLRNIIKDSSFCLNDIIIDTFTACLQYFVI